MCVAVVLYETIFEGFPLRVKSVQESSAAIVLLCEHVLGRLHYSRGPSHLTYGVGLMRANSYWKIEGFHV